MGGGGKSQTSTSTVSIPPEVLARYNSVNAQAQQAAAAPFQPYTGEFVAPINQTQQSGIAATGAAAGQAQPYYGAAAGLTLGSAQPVGPLTQNQIGYYQNPYTQAVVGSTEAALSQQFGQQQSQQQADAIKAGAFGGERAGLQRAQLMGQQGLAAAQAISPLYQQGYQQAVQTAQGQQGVIASDLARQMQAGQQLGALGSGAQAAALQGAQAQIGAGTLAQQTQQAGDTAQYQQYLQQQGYPFQVAQFLANIAEGTGALSGSTTTSTQPSSFFSDRRLKHDAKKIGETKDGLPIYSFKYNGDDRTQIGLMAQDVEKKHPEAVGESGGYKTVDYEKALHPARKAYGGGLDPNSMGGVVSEPGAFARGGFAMGGLSETINPNDLQALLAQQQKSFGPFAQQGLYAGSSSGMPNGAGGAGVVPQQQMHVAHLMTAGAPPKPAPSTMSTISDEYSKLNSIANDMTGTSLSKRAGNKFFGTDAVPAQQNAQGQQTAAAQPATPGLVQEGWDKLKGLFSSEQPSGNYRGGLVRHHYDAGGDVEPYDFTNPTKGYVEPSVKEGDAEKNRTLAVAGKGPGAGPSGASELTSALGLGNAAMNFGSGVAGLFDAAPEVMAGLLSTGGVASRHHYADGGGDQGAGSAGIGAAITPDQLKTLSTDTGDDTSEGTSDILAGVKPRQGLKGADAANQYMDYLVNKKGLDSHVAAGMLGNAYHESSGLQPNIVGDSGNAIGLFQFNRKGEQPALRQWAAQNNRDISDPYAQLDFATERLQGPYFQTLQAMQASKDPASAAAIFMDGYERPKAGPTAALSQRMAYANAIANGEELPNFRAYAGSQPGAGDAAASQAIQRAAPSPQGGMGAASPSGDTSQPGFFDNIGLNRQTLVPLLQGLAGMAGSKSRYLGSAILEGLGAGAKSYGEQQDQQAALLGKNIENVQNLYNNWRSVNYLNPMPFSQYAAAVGYKGPIPPSLMGGPFAGTAGAGAGSARPSIGSPAAIGTANVQDLISAYQNNAVTDYNGTKVSAQNDPVFLSRLRAALAPVASTDKIAAGMYTEAGNKLSEIKGRGNMTYDVSGQQVPVPGSLEAGTEAVGIAQSVKNYADEVGKSTAALQGLQQSQNVIDNMKDAYKNFQAGPGSAPLARTNALINTVNANFGTKIGSVGDKDAANPTAYYTALKEAANSVSSQFASVPGIAGAPKAGINLFESGTPNPDMAPGAIHHVMSQMEANVELANRWYSGLQDPEFRNKYGNINNYQKQFLSNPENQLSNIQQNKYDAIGPLKGEIPIIKTPEALSSVKGSNDFILGEGFDKSVQGENVKGMTARVVRNDEELRAAVNEAKRAQKKIAIIPTYGNMANQIGVVQ